MPRWTRLLVLIPFWLTAHPAAAQDPPDLDRLEALRFERMREALDLGPEQVQALRSTLEEQRHRNRELRESQQQTMERLRQALQSDDQAAVEEALAALERRRTQAQDLRAQDQRRLAEVLRPEQRARFLLFNQQFDRRLRELIQRRRGGPARPGCPPACGDSLVRERRPMPVPRGERRPPLERRLRDLSPEERQRTIDRLRAEIQRLERRLQEVERDDR